MSALHPHRARGLAEELGRAFGAFEAGDLPAAKRLLLHVERECARSGVHSAGVALGLLGVAGMERDAGALIAWTSQLLERESLAPTTHARVAWVRGALDCWLHQPMYRRGHFDAAAVRSWRAEHAGHGGGIRK